jgi:predicted ATP-dependent endonuclease of OLD family
MVTIENFKGIKKLEIVFKDGKTFICGQNATGKTSVVDAICWLLFNKDSLGREKFNIRMLDASGEKIHYDEIVVCGECEVDGKPYTFKKTHKENWVKAR